MPILVLTMLEMRNVVSGYGSNDVLRGISLIAEPGEVLCLLGRNGAGKTTLLKSIMGLVRTRSGEILFGSHQLHKLAAHEIPRLGVGYVPQGRRLFSDLTVDENLTVGLMVRDAGPAVRLRILEMFPALRDRLKQKSGTMSGGEQQMLAMARALCIEPQLLLLDEPTEGLMPKMIERIQKSVLDLKQNGVTSLIVEQRVDAAIAVADRVAFIDRGKIASLVSSEVLRRDASLIEQYVGINNSVVDS
jgi:branched-chain amino acid transport system ATP-binding protein